MADDGPLVRGLETTTGCPHAAAAPGAGQGASVVDPTRSGGAVAARSVPHWPQNRSAAPRGAPHHGQNAAGLSVATMAGGTVGAGVGAAVVAADGAADGDALVGPLSGPAGSNGTWDRSNELV